MSYELWEDFVHDVYDCLTQRLYRRLDGMFVHDTGGKVGECSLVVYIVL